MCKEELGLWWNGPNYQVIRTQKRTITSISIKYICLWKQKAGGTLYPSLCFFFYFFLFYFYFILFYFFCCILRVFASFDSFCLITLQYYITANIEQGSWCDHNKGLLLLLFFCFNLVFLFYFVYLFVCLFFLATFATFKLSTLPYNNLDRGTRTLQNYQIKKTYSIWGRNKSFDRWSDILYICSMILRLLASPD